MALLALPLGYFIGSTSPKELTGTEVLLTTFYSGVSVYALYIALCLFSILPDLVDWALMALKGKNDK